MIKEIAFDAVWAKKKTLSTCAIVCACVYFELSNLVLCSFALSFLSSLIGISATSASGRTWCFSRMVNGIQHKHAVSLVATTDAFDFEFGDKPNFTKFYIFFVFFGDPHFWINSIWYTYGGDTRHQCKSWNNHFLAQPCWNVWCPLQARVQRMLVPGLREKHVPVHHSWAVLQCC